MTSTEQQLCALLKSNEHFAVEPLKLPSCGHLICMSCIFEYEFVSCKCGFIIEKGLLLRQFGFKELERQFMAQINSLKEMSITKNEKIDKHLRFIEDEIEIRIESMKNQLDEMLNAFKSELQEIKLDIIKHTALNTDEYENLLKQLRYDIEHNKEKVYEYENIMFELNEKIRKLNDMSFKLKFDESTIELKKNDYVGKIIYSRLNKKVSIKHDDIKRKIEGSDYEVIELNVLPWDICAISSDQIACCDMNSNCIAVYDRNFQLLKVLSVIDGKKYQPVGITINESGQIYIADRLNECILMVDSNFNRIKTVGGSDQLKFKNITSLCCSQYFVYAADFINKRIQVLDFDLEFIEFINLDCNPVTIGVLNETLCVNGTHFYDINSKVLKKKIACENYWTKLTVHNSLFYVFSYESSKFSCFNTDGVLIDEINAKRMCQIVTINHDGCMLKFNDSMLISSLSGKKLIKILLK